MPLILAVEPDRRQASNLAMVLRGRPRTELVIAESAALALAELGERVPQVLLTSALLSHQDEVALSAWMRSLGPSAARVQELTIPILATATPPAPRKRSMLSKLRRREKAAPAVDGCEPSMFADQVGFYLNQAKSDIDLAQARADVHVELPPPPPVVAIEETAPPVVVECRADARVAPAEPAEEIVAVADAIVSEPVEEIVADADAIVPEPVEEIVAVAEEIVPVPVEEPAAVEETVVLEERRADVCVAPAVRLPDFRVLSAHAPTVVLPSLLAYWPVSRISDDLTLWRVRWTPPAVEHVQAVEAAVEEPSIATEDVAAALEEPAIAAPVKKEFVARLRELGDAGARALVLPSLAASWSAARLENALALWRTRWTPPVLEDFPLMEPPAAPVEAGEEWVAVALEVVEEAAPPEPEPEPDPEAVEDDVWVLPSMADLDQLVVVQPPAPVPAPAPAPRKRAAQPKKAKPVQDEWGFFDPEQCGFAALLAKLDEITDEEDADEKDPDTTVRLIAY